MWLLWLAAIAMVGAILWKCVLADRDGGKGSTEKGLISQWREQYERSPAGRRKEMGRRYRAAPPEQQAAYDILTKAM